MAARCDHGICELLQALRYSRERDVGAWRRPITAETLVIWGERDRYLGRELAEPPREQAPNARVARLPSASHWVQMDEPARVNALLVEFLSGRLGE